MVRQQKRIKTSKREFEVVLSDCARNPKQKDFIECNKKRIIVRAGRRGGKTYGVSQKAVRRFLRPSLNRVLYAAPTIDQVQAFWFTVSLILQPLISAGVLVKNETEHTIERPGTRQRIRAKTAWNADTLRGDYADLLILDEWQLMNEDAWELVGAPMLLDNNGDAAFIYTPPSLHPGKKTFVSKANDPQHAAKMYKLAAKEMAEKGGASRWAAFHWTSKDNGYISAEAIDEIAQDMTKLAYRQEIEAEDIDEAPGALWTRKMFEDGRMMAELAYDRVNLELDKIVVGVDPSGSTTGDECGIVVCGRKAKEFYVLSDRSMQARPEAWAARAVGAYKDFEADAIVAEINFGGLMVESTLRAVDPNVAVKMVTASRGKAVRAEPISAIYEQGRAHHVGSFPKLENECCLWMPGMPSPNRMDALVWGGTNLMLGSQFGFLESVKKQAQAAMGVEVHELGPNDTIVVTEGDTSSPKERQRVWRETVVAPELTRSFPSRKAVKLRATAVSCPKCGEPMQSFANLSQCVCGYRVKTEGHV